MKLVGCKSALSPPVVYSTDRSKAVAPVLVFLFFFYSTKRLVLNIALCYCFLLFVSPFSIVIISLGEERANRSAFLMFVRFALV